MGKNIYTVKEWMDWRFGNSESSERQNEAYTKSLGWEITDVLYSFFGIYALGILVFYPEEYERTDYMIKESKTNKNVYSSIFIRKKYAIYKELNEFIEKSGFVSKYFEIGNIYPIWPGGNKDKGITWNFDLPEIYFNKDQNKRWVQILKEIYQNSYLDEVTNPAWYCDEDGEHFEGIPRFEFKNAKDFLDSIVLKEHSKNKKIELYKEFLSNRVIKIIEKRTQLIKSEMNNRERWQ